MPSSVRLSTILWTLWFVLLALNIADAITTSMAFDRGIAEANPLMQDWTLDQIYAAKALVLGVIAYILVLKVHQVTSAWVAMVMLMATLAYATVVGINIGGLAALA